MIISYFGKALVKAQLGDTIFAFNPISKDSKEKATKFGADITMISLNDPDFNGQEAMAFGSKEPFVIEGPGEYEIGGIFVRGFSSAGPEGKINTIYTTTLDGIRLCHLGALASPDISPKIIEEIGIIDVLFLPLGDNGSLTPKEAAKLAAALEAKVIVPILFDDSALKLFLKESGEEKEVAVDKLSIKRKDIEGKEGEIVVIRS